MKNLILQVQIPEDKNVRCHKKFEYVKNLYDLSKKSAIKYSGYTNSDYICINDFSYLPNFSAAFQRYAMFDMNDYDYIFYVDSDAIITEICPNIFDLKIEGLAAVADFDKNDINHLKRIKTVNKNLNLQNSELFCNGIFLCDRNWRLKIKDIFLYIIKKEPNMRDQHALNKAQNGINWHELSYHWGAWYKRGDYIKHYGGKRGKQEFKELLSRREQ